VKLKELFNYSNKVKVIFSTFLICILVWFYGTKRFIKKPNILIISYCSFRPDLLNSFGSNIDNAPFLNELSKKSLNMKSIITDQPWSNLSGFLLGLTRDYLSEHSYKAIGNPWTKSQLSYYKIDKDIPANFLYEIQPQIKTSKNLIKTDINFLKSQFTNKKNWPFISMVHSKLAHVPYNKKIGTMDQVIDHLDSVKRKKLENFIQNFSKFPERLPLALLVFERGEYLNKLVAKALNVKAEEIAHISESKIFMGILNNTNILNSWANSKYFREDLELVKEIYKIQSRQIDHELKELLTFFGDKELESNTIVIFINDHGESFFETGKMSHGEIVDDISIKLGGFIKFPEVDEQNVFSEQLYVGSIAILVTKLIEKYHGHNSVKDLLRHLAFKDKYVYSRNCTGDVESLRYKNWKLVKNHKKDEDYLYQLSKDEVVDVKDLYPSVFFELQDTLPEVKRLQVKSSQISHCRSF